MLVVYGFSQTIAHNLLHASPLQPFILTIHAIVFPGWVLFFILQSALVRTRNVPLHRTLIVDRRIHKVYLYAFPLFILFQIFCMQTYLHTSPWCVPVATALLR